MGGLFSQGNFMTIESAFAEQDVIYPSSLLRDERIHRCPTIRKPRSKNGWYVAYADGAAIIGNWENGDGYKIFQTEGKDDSKFDRSRIEALKKQREREHENCAKEAIELSDSLPRQGFSEYLQKKKLVAPGAIRFLDNSILIIPLQDAEGKIWSYQKIYPDGSKYFMPGGRVKGCFFRIFPQRSIDEKERIIICEGLATGASIHEATGLPVIVALNAGNLKTVADSLSFRNILIAADNDKNKAGENAAEESGYPYILPPKEGEDFSDVFVNEGIDAVKRLFIESPKDSELPQALKVHGLVGDIADWITATAVLPQPMLSLAAALTFVGMLKGHRVRGYTDLRTNLLILGLAPTAAGKEHPQHCLRKLARLTGLKTHLMGEPVSGAGFLYALQKAGNVGLMVMDEVGRYIGNLSHKNAAVHQREIIDYIIKTFSSANSILMGREKAPSAKEPRIDIDQPHFCCYGSTVPEKFRDACGSSEVVDGFLNRWLLFSVTTRPDRRQKVKQLEPSVVLIERIKSIAEKPSKDSFGNPIPSLVRFTPEAWTNFLTYRALMDSMVAKAKYPLNQLYARSCEHIEKVAHTLADDPEWTTIEDLRLAIDIVTQSNRAIAQFAEMLSDNVQEKDYIRVREILKESGEIQHSTLLRRCQFITGGARRFGEIVNNLTENGDIVSRHATNKKTIYKWISTIQS